MADAAVARRRRVGILSSSEKITGAKNAQADALLQQLLQRFQAESRKSTAELQALCECVSHDLHMLSLEQRCSALAERRRLDPEADYSHEYSAVASMRKYLALTSAGGALGSAGALAGGAAPAGDGGAVYVNRQQAHRIRRLARPDSRSPAVTQAQAAIRRRAVEKAVHERRMQQQQQRAKSSGDEAVMPRPRGPTRQEALGGTRRLAKSGYGTVRPHGGNSRSSGRLVTSTRASRAEVESPEGLGNDEGSGREDEEDGNRGESDNDAGHDDDNGIRAGKLQGGWQDQANAAPSRSGKGASGGSDHGGKQSGGGGRKTQLQSRERAAQSTKPVSLTAMKEYWQRVQARVKAFCSECEQVTKVRRAQERASDIKFSASSKDRSWAEHGGALLRLASGDAVATSAGPGAT